MIAIIDYGLGNVRSVSGALEAVGACPIISKDHDQILDAEKIILPGVGSFRAAMEAIDDRGLREVLRESVLVRKTPILGICLGMQLLGESGDEDGPTPGLGLIAAEVKRFPDLEAPLRVPHIGFNRVTFVPGQDELFAGLGAHADFYFVHSYRMVCRDPSDVSGWCDYGDRFTASVKRGHIYGTQFHPEKSQTNGLRVLASFVASPGRGA